MSIFKKISFVSLFFAVFTVPATDDSESWRLLEILLSKNSFASDKLYKGSIEALGIEYIDHSRYEINSQKMPIIAKEQLGVYDRYWYERYNRYIVEKYEAPWYMKFINEKIGHGIFAAADIKGGDYIGDYVGIICDSQLWDKVCRDTSYSWRIGSPSEINSPHVFSIDAKHTGNFTRFINHSFDPNVIAISIYTHDGWHLVYIAKKDIHKDEQILADYGRGYWDVRKQPEELH